jgi:serine/threonine protein kinase
LGSDLENHPNYGVLSLNQILRLFEQIVTGIHYAHGKGVAHRDIKPNNIVLSNDTSTAYIIDFGISQFPLDNTALTNSSEPLGNRGFSAPECNLGRIEKPSFPADIYSLGKLLYWMVSGGSYINREDLSDYSLSKIQSDSQQIRFYIERILRRTIREKTAERWDISTLLEEVQNTLNLIHNYESYAQSGKSIVYDSFGLNDGFDSSSSRSATMPSQGNPPADGDVGTAFTIPQRKNLKLESLYLALALREGSNSINIWLAEDQNGKPNGDNIIEAFALDNVLSHSGSVISVFSSKNSILKVGKTYWIIISVPTPNTNVAWLSAPLDFQPLKVLLAERFDLGEWEIRESPSGPGYAFRIIAFEDNHEE